MKTNIKKRDLAKITVEIIISAGVGIVVNNAVDLITPHNTGKVKKALMRVGALSIAGVITTAAARQTASFIDSVADGIDQGRAARAALANEGSTIGNPVSDLTGPDSTEVTLDIPSDDA